MAGKLHAILTRRFMTGGDQTPSIKGRDYYDLLWFVKKAVVPNIKRLSDMLGEPITLEDVKTKVNRRVRDCVTKHKTAFQFDLLPMISNPDFVKIYVTNFAEEFERNEGQSFG